MQVSAYHYSDALKSYSSPRPETGQSSQKNPTNSSKSREAEEKYRETNQQRELQNLKSVDRAVRAHELAHLAVGGRYVTSGANFQYQRGADGRNYAVAGEVSIDTSEIPGDPRATLAKELIILRAALAPVNPSTQDRQVAAEAISKIQQARVDVLLQSPSEQTGRVGGQLDTFV
jgi:hypothetical protein